MLICINIGNTNTTFGIFKKNKLGKSHRVSSQILLSIEEWGNSIRELTQGIKSEKIEGVIISSVVPVLTSVCGEMSKKLLNLDPVIVSSKLPLGIKILYDDPVELGADRIANAVAAFEIYGGPVIVVDLGTATTFDVVSEKGEFLGGAIAPGIETSSLTLFQKTALLPQVRLKKPKKIVASNTQDSLRSGIIYGAIGQVDEIVKRIKKELGRKTRVIATGGLVELIYGESNTIKNLDPTLTLKGLKIIYDRVRTSRKFK